jgi:hypothetical protein
MFIIGVNDTGDKFRKKNAMEVESCQRKKQVEGVKTAISPAAEVGHGRRWCRWNRDEKAHP